MNSTLKGDNKQLHRMWGGPGLGRKELRHEELYRGDLAEVRSPSEILATLDESGALGGASIHARNGCLLRPAIHSGPPGG